MFRLFLAASLLAVPTDAAAQSSYSDQIELCAKIGNLAEVVMDDRQDGIPQSEARSTWLGALRRNNAGPELYKMVMVIIEAAYKRPQFSTQAYRQKEISRFRDQMETICFGLDDTDDEASDEQLWIGDT